MLYPAFVEQFATPEERVADNSIIVVSGDKFKVIAPRDMFTYEFDMQTWQERLVSIDFEPQISKAIQFVTLDEAPVLYRVTGSNEIPLPENLINLIEIENYIYREIDLLLNEVPEDCDMLLITMPRRDWSTDKAERILEYLQNDGRALMVMGYQAQRFPHMDGVLSAYGVAVGDYIVLEGDTNRFYMGVPSFLIPLMAANDITQPIIDRRFPTLFVESTAIEELPLKRTSTVIESIVGTSNASYGKKNTESITPNKEPGDVDGPFDLGVTITDTYYVNRTHTTKIVIYGSHILLDETANSMIGGTNWDLLINSLHWLSEQPVSIFIPSKSPSGFMPLSMTQFQATVVAGIAAIGMPLLFIAAGLGVWLRRRHS
jgi:ABC-2 type transport system permease protein